MIVDRDLELMWSNYVMKAHEAVGADGEKKTVLLNVTWL